MKTFITLAVMLGATMVSARADDTRQVADGEGIVTEFNIRMPYEGTVREIRVNNMTRFVWMHRHGMVPPLPTPPPAIASK